MKSVSEPRTVVLVPRRAGIEDRDRLWAFAKAWWEADFPDWTIVEGVHEFGPFNRSAAINDAADKAGDWDVAVIIDADVLADPKATREAVQIAHETNKMVLGYHERIHLTPRGTERIVTGYRGNWRGPGFIAKTFPDACSSLVCVSRKLFESVNGFDERFSGWGWEDIAFRIACETISGEEMVIVKSSLWHLHHRTSHENNRREVTFQANKIRGNRYIAAHWDPVAVRALLDETVIDIGPVELGPSRIPRILHRTVPAAVNAQAEAWWAHWQQLLPGWELMTHRDPLDPAEWPETSDLWKLCKNGAQLAGLIRLEALWRWGGIYVDSDVEPYRSLEPLVQCQAFAAWEDRNVVPDAVLGAEPNHPAVKLMLTKARLVIEAGGDAWTSGPGVTTSTLPGRSDWLLFPPGSFFPYSYKEKHLRFEDHMEDQPWCFCVHHWEGSWLTPKQKAQQARMQTRGGRTPR